MAAVMKHGTQSIERALLVLKVVASRGKFGWGLRDLAERCELDRGTTHRIVAGLVRERMVHQRKRDRHYLPGALLFELSLAMPEYARFQAACQTPLSRIARRYSGLAFLYLRSAGDFVCAGCSGTPVFLGTAMEVGTRRPLISSAGGLAIFLTLPKDEARLVVAENVKRLTHLGDASLRALEQMRRRSEEMGIAFNQSETARGIHALAVPIHNQEGIAFASVTITAPAATLPATLAAEVISYLQQEARVIERHALRMFEDM